VQRKVASALGPTVLLEPGQHDDDGQVLLPNHAPQVDDSAVEGALQRRRQFPFPAAPMHQKYLHENVGAFAGVAVHVVRVDVGGRQGVE